MIAAAGQASCVGSEAARSGTPWIHQPGQIRHAVVVQHCSARVDASSPQPPLAWRCVCRHNLRRRLSALRVLHVEVAWCTCE